MPSQVFASVFDDSWDVKNQDETSPPKKDHANSHAFIANIDLLDVTLQCAWMTCHIPLDYAVQSSIELTSHNSQGAFVLLQQTIDRFQGILKSQSKGQFGEEADHTRSAIQALFANILPLHQFESVLSFVLFVIGSRLLGIELDGSFQVHGLPHRADKDDLYVVLDVLIEGLQECGLGGDQAARAYAVAIDNLLDLLTQDKMWTDDSNFYNRAQIECYVADTFIPVIKRLMMPLKSLDVDAARLTMGQDIRDGVKTDLLPEVRFWAERCLARVANLMSKQLYNLIIDGRVENDESLATDLEDIVSTPAARGHVALELGKQLAWQLLHPGSSTVSILDAYSQLIWALRRIDKSGVLLVRTARDISNFLQNRDDAVKIVILSFLEAGEDDNKQPKLSGENFSGRIAKLMNDAIKVNAVAQIAYYPGKDLKDINWEPEPVDAFTGYRAARYRDAMGHMVTIREKDDFIEELRSILGERLLKADNLNPWKEVRLLEVFKGCFEDFPIRECEIMVKDMQDSYFYCRSLAMKRNIPIENPDNLQVKVLSHTYWPTLREERFELPPPMKLQMDDYAREFQEIKQYRQLDWINAQGRVTVELVLEDRTIVEEVTTWQAAVIYQFDKDEMGRVSSAQAGTRSISDIEAAIQMDEDLIRSALTFWVGKLVLLESVTYPDAYTVLERLSTTSAASTNEDHLGALSSIAVAAAAAAQQAETEAAAAELKTAADVLAENAPLYANFVINMLTNQGHMPASRMVMMLKMLMAGGFPFEEAEFVEFLQGLAEEGKIEKAGGLWMIKK